MRNLKFLAYAFLVAAFTGCTGTGINSANIYEPQSGSIKLDVSSLPDPSAYTSVAFMLDEKQIGEDTDGSDGFSFTLDTVAANVADGIHNVKAIGTTTAGTTEELLNNSLFVQNGGAAPTATASPEETASPEAGESPEASASSSPGADESPAAEESPSTEESASPDAGASSEETTDAASQLRR